MIFKIILGILGFFVNTTLVFADWTPISKLGLKAALEFELKNMDSKSIQLNQFKNQVVLVNFWATWCEPCKDEFSELIYLQEKYRTQGLAIIAVNLAESRPRIQTFLKSNLLPLNSLEIVLDNNSLIYKSWKVKGIPTTYLVNKRGIVESFWMGPVDAENPNFIKPVEKLLDK